MYPVYLVQGDSLVCISHSWLSNRHVLVATEHGKVCPYLHLRM